MTSSYINSLLNKSIEDEQFGLLQFNKLTKDAWRGKAHFEPTGDEIDIYIFDLAEDKVSEIHKDFYLNLAQHYPTFVDEIADLLYKEDKQVGGILARKDVWKKFKLAGISFPLIESLRADNFEWDLYYSHAPKADSFLIEMSNWKPSDCYAGESPIS